MGTTWPILTNKGSQNGNHLANFIFKKSTLTFAKLITFLNVKYRGGVPLIFFASKELPEALQEPQVSDIHTTKMAIFQKKKGSQNGVQVDFCRLKTQNLLKNNTILHPLKWQNHV